MDRQLPELDANDLLYQINASRDYDPSGGLEKIQARVTWINSADDFVNPPELGIAEREVEEDQERALHFVARLRPNARTRHPPLGGGVAAIPERACSPRPSRKPEG